MKGKTFIKYFLIFLVIFTLILIPAVNAISGINLFKFDRSSDLEGDFSVGIDENSPMYDNFSESGRMNLLMIGVNNGMTDTIMVVSWNLDENNVDIISVPRDTRFERPGYRGASLKINAIYSSEGLNALAEAVSDVLCGMPIDYYAVVEYDAVKNIVNGIGGVPIYVQQSMHYEDPYDTPPLVIDIEEGQQVLDGEKAVQYLRFRHGYANGDIGRIEAQQEFMKAMFRQGIDHGVIDSVKLITSNVQSDLTLGAVSKYALSILRLDGDSIASYTIPGVAKYIDSLSFYVQDEEATEELLREIY